MPPSVRGLEALDVIVDRGVNDGFLQEGFGKRCFGREPFFALEPLEEVADEEFEDMKAVGMRTREEEVVAKILPGFQQFPMRLALDKVVCFVHSKRFARFKIWRDLSGRVDS